MSTLFVLMMPGYVTGGLFIARLDYVTRTVGTTLERHPPQIPIDISVSLESTLQIFGRNNLTSEKDYGVESVRP